MRLNETAGHQERQAQTQPSLKPNTSMPLDSLQAYVKPQQTVLRIRHASDSDVDDATSGFYFPNRLSCAISAPR